MTSRQLVNQKELEDRIELLLRKQAVLEARSANIDDLIDRAQENGVESEPERSSAIPADRSPVLAGLGFRGGWDGQREAASLLPVSLARSMPVPDITDRNDVKDLFESLASRVAVSERKQLAALDLLETATAEKLERNHKALAWLGIGGIDAGAAGGPFLSASGSSDPDDDADALAESMDRLAALNRLAESLPIAYPVAGGRVSSAFGRRIDPFLRRMAMHSGIDFAVDAGTPVYAAGSGVIVEAGWNGGYGKSVVIDHGHGLTSRFGHLQTILVTIGETVEAGAEVGLVGSTGRSTGPHLHYEIHRDDRAEDPAKYLKAGRQLL